MAVGSLPHFGPQANLALNQVLLHFFTRHLWLIVAGGGVGVAGRYLSLCVRRAHTLTRPDPTVELLRLHQLHGYNAHSLVGIAPGIRFWTCPETGEAVAYNEVGRVWLVPGDPLASCENLPLVLEGFLRKAHAERRIVGLMPTTQRLAKIGSSLGLRVLKVGAAPYFDLATWAPRGDRGKKARAGVNQARRAGVSVTEVINVNERLIRETACLCKSWLTTRRSAVRFGWLFSVDLFQHKELKRYFTARDSSGRLVGFLAASPLPARDGWYLEDILRRREAPNGTTDLLVVAALETFKRDGARLATLGTAPMANEGEQDVPISPVLPKVMRFVTSFFSIFYNFEGVRRFKAKFAPSWWESEYILLSHNVTAPPRILSAFIQATVPTGPSNLIARQMSRALRHMTTSNEPITNKS